MTGLAGYVTDGQLSSQGVKKLIKTLNSFKKQHRHFRLRRCIILQRHLCVILIIQKKY